MKTFLIAASIIALSITQATAESVPAQVGEASGVIVSCGWEQSGVAEKAAGLAMMMDEDAVRASTLQVMLEFQFMTEDQQEKFCASVIESFRSNGLIKN